MAQAKNIPIMTTQSEWQRYLTSQNATYKNGVAINFHDQEKELQAFKTGTILSDLSHKGIIRISGEEASTFLQNQFCNDVGLVNETQSQLNAYCTPKGRVLSLFRLFRFIKQKGQKEEKESYYIQLPRERLGPMSQRLNMYLLMTKAKITDASADIIFVGLSGANAEPTLQSIFNNIPNKINQCSQYTINLSKNSRDFMLIKVPGASRFMIAGNSSSMIDLWPELLNSATAVGADVWELSNIAAGIPQVTEANVEAFIPQMLNLHWVNAISFSKGCYPGQEIVARTKYLGKLKRRLYVAHIDGPQGPEPGTDIFNSSHSDGQKVGKIVSAARAPDGGTDVLAVLQIASVNTEGTNLQIPAIGALTIKDLPYSVEELEV